MKKDKKEEGKLSDRELDILQRLANGKASKHIATDLSISVDSVNFHRRNLLDKLDAENVAQLIYSAAKKGII